MPNEECMHTIFGVRRSLIVQLFLYVGITVKGAVDDLDLVIKTLSEAGFTEDRFYIHCDGALFGFMMPFVEKVYNSMLLGNVHIISLSLCFWAIYIFISRVLVTGV